MEITGKRVLITGANRGIGFALAVACAKAGASEIVAGARQLDSLAELQSQVAATGAKFTPVKLDVTSDEDAQAAAGLGRMDIVINNAGIAAPGGALKGNWDTIRQEADVNYFGVLRVVRAFAPAMAEHGDGMIVNIASVLSKVSLPMLSTYCATKSALLMLTRSLQAELSPRGVRVISLLPGTIDTDMARGFNIPKMPVDAAAAEMLDAIRKEETELPIGDEARRMLAGMPRA